jgi:hypothetical protein
MPGLVRLGTAGYMLLVLLASAITHADRACAQDAATPHPAPPTTPSQAPAPNQTPIALGSACTRRTDTKPGIVKRDACGRWYCGRADFKDVIEVRPNIAAELGCKWVLELNPPSGAQCRCRPIAANAQPK